jgi:hypothetical protein
MRMPRVQFTVGRMMVGIAILALLLAIPLWIARLVWLRAQYVAQAAHNATWEAIYRRTERGWRTELALLRATHRAGDSTQQDRIAQAEKRANESYEMADLFFRRRRISERLASHPWESVPPDPAERRPGTEYEGPALIFEISTSERLEFSSGLIVRCAIAPLLAAFGYGALRWKWRSVSLSSSSRNIDPRSHP